MYFPWSVSAGPRPSPIHLPFPLEKKYLHGLAPTEDEETQIERFAKPDHYSSLLEYMCAWDSASIESLKPLLEEMKELMPAEYWDTDPRPVFSLCANKLVSLELFELLLEYFPSAASFASSQFCYVDMRLWVGQDFSAEANLLHVACASEFCPDTIVESLLKSNPSALLAKCVLGSGTDLSASQDGTPQVHTFPVDGTPLHYLLKMRSALRLSTVQMVVECDESVLGTMGVYQVGGGEEYTISPLDCLAWNESIGDMIDILRYILRCIKDQGVEVVDNNRRGVSPLHLICQNPKATRKAVEVILKEFPGLMTRFSEFDEQLLTFSAETSSWVTLSRLVF